MSAARGALALAGVVAATALVALAAGCGSHYTGVMPVNQRPVVRLTQAPSSTTQPYFYAYEMRWTGYDEDGRVDHYIYAVDPPTASSSDTQWVSTTDNRKLLVFRSSTVDSSKALYGHDYHRFVVKAVDNGGLVSAPASCAFNSFTIAPTVTLLNPIPNPINTFVFGLAFRLTWKGVDPDGRSTTRPVKYKWKIFSDDNIDLPLVSINLHPDTLRVLYGPGFAAWDSCGGDTTSVDIRGLQQGKNYLFALVAFDEAGAFSPLFSFDSNLLYFSIVYSGQVGPILTVYNETFYYAFGSPLYAPSDEATYIKADLAADLPITFHWKASTPSSATFVQGFRWMLDGDVADETVRSNEVTDTRHWSQWSPGTTSATLPPIVPPPGVYSQPHFFYLEAQDNEGQRSLAVVKFNAIRPTFDHDLLFVDDARLTPDRLLSNGTIDRPRGAWPTAAELDTFFYAVGGFSWKTYPAGIMSPVGAFAGYTFDTLGTRFQHGGVLSLTDLGHYKHIVWFVDGKGAQNPNPVDFSRDPMPALHAFSYPGVSNPLGTWVKQGGKLWLMGGGCATCLQIQYDLGGIGNNVFSNANGELVPGRFMYDVAHWQSEITVSSSVQAAKSQSIAAPRASGPDYTELPDYLMQKYSDTDPFNIEAPNRTSPADFYQTSFYCEVLTKPNIVLEDVDPSANIVYGSVLDTLYTASGSTIGVNRPIMTYYRGGQVSPMVFMGMPLWFMQRAQVIQVGDFVLQNLWGLQRRPIPR